LLVVVVRIFFVVTSAILWLGQMFGWKESLQNDVTYNVPSETLAQPKHLYC